MAITVTSRPEKTLANGYISRWNSSELPLKYNFSSDLYPVNSYDLSFTVTNGAYNYALKGFELTIGVHPYINLNTVQVSGTNTSLDGGIFSIKATTTNTVILDFFTTETTTTGSIIKYYNNYNGVVKVYAGARDGHPYNTTGIKPFTLIGEIVANFDNDNKSSIDIRSYIKPDITADFDSVNENSRFAWTDFTIEFSESYDESNGTIVETYNSDFEPDEQPNCTPFTGFIDPSFNNGLDDWSQESLPATSSSVWVAGVGEIESTTTTETRTNIINQSLSILSGVPYTITLNYDLISAVLTDLPQIIVFGYSSGSWVFIQREYVSSLGAGVSNINLTTSQNFEKLGVSFSYFNGTTSNTFNIKFSSLQVTTTVSQPCKIYSSAIFGCKQFQDALGGNFGDYVLNITDDFEPKLLTHFEELKKFNGVDIYLNALIPESTFSLSEDANNVFVEINLFDRGNNNVLAFNYKVENLGSGVYTVTPTIDEDLDFNNVLPCEWEHGTIRFIIIPSNTFSDADNGTFENGTTTGITSLPYDISTPNYIGGNIGVNSFGKTGVFCGSIQWTTPIASDPTKQYLVFENDTALNVVVDRVYEIKSFISITGYNPNQLDNGSFYWMPNGYTKEECIIKPFEITTANTYVTPEPTQNDWYEITTKFTAKATGSLNLIMYEDMKTDVGFTIGAFNIDDITFKGPFEYISEEKKVNNSCGCSYGNILRWKNNLGGWESWNFQNKRIESEVVSNKINIKRDVTQDWDNYFINGETENDTIKTDVSRSITFNSQILTNNEYKVLQAIKRSVRVQMLQDSGKWQTVTVKGGSYEIINDDERVKELSVTFELPSIKTQEQ